MPGRAARITLLAIFVGLAVILAYQYALPTTPITDATYMLAGLIGVLVASVLDWLWTRVRGKSPS